MWMSMPTAWPRARRGGTASRPPATALQSQVVSHHTMVTELCPRMTGWTWGLLLVPKGTPRLRGECAPCRTWRLRGHLLGGDKDYRQCHRHDHSHARHGLAHRARGAVPGSTRCRMLPVSPKGPQRVAKGHWAGRGPHPAPSAGQTAGPMAAARPRLLPARAPYRSGAVPGTAPRSCAPPPPPAHGAAQAMPCPAPLRCGAAVLPPRLPPARFPGGGPGAAARPGPGQDPAGGERKGRRTGRSIQGGHRGSG